MNIIVAVDGSEVSLRALAYALRRASACAGHAQLELHVLNVQVPLRGSVSMFLDRPNIDDYHRDEGMKALEPARALLAATPVKHQIHIEVGKPGEVIEQYVKTLGAEEVIMGTRGMGNIADLVIGSTSEEVLRVASVPVVLVK